MTSSDQGHERAADARPAGLNASLPAALARAGQPPTVIDVQAAARGVDNRTGWAGRRLDALAGWAGRWLPRSAAGNPAAGLTLARRALAQGQPVSLIAGNAAVPLTVISADLPAPIGPSAGGLPSAPGMRVPRRGLIADGAAGQPAAPAVAAAIPAPIPTDGTGPAGGPVGASAESPVTAASIDIDLGAGVFAAAANQAGSALPLAVGPATPASVRGAPSAAGPSDQTPPALGLRLHRRMTQPGLIALRDLTMSVDARAPSTAASITGAAAPLLRRLTERSAFAAAEPLMRAPALPLTAAPLGGPAGDAAAGESVAGTARDPAVPGGAADGDVIASRAAVAMTVGAAGQVRAPGGNSITPTVPGGLARLAELAREPVGEPVRESPIPVVRAAHGVVPGGIAAGAGTETLLQRRAAPAPGAAGPTRDAPVPSSERGAPPTRPDASFDLGWAIVPPEVIGQDRHGEGLFAAARSGALHVSPRTQQAAHEAALPVAAARLMRRADPIDGRAAGPVAAVAPSRSIPREVSIETAAAAGVGGLVGSGSGWPLVAGAAERARDVFRLDRRRNGAADRANAPAGGGHVVPATANDAGSETRTNAAGGPVMAVGRVPGAGAPPALVWRSPLARASGAGGGLGDPLARLAGGAAGALTGGGSGGTLARRAETGGTGGSAGGSIALPAPPAPTAAPVLDPELLAEQVARVLARRFEIERERRGGGGQWR